LKTQSLIEAGTVISQIKLIVNLIMMLISILKYNAKNLIIYIYI